jgi:hypothetical protein
MFCLKLKPETLFYLLFFLSQVNAQSTCLKCDEWLKEEGSSRVDVPVAERTLSRNGMPGQ